MSPISNIPSLEHFQTSISVILCCLPTIYSSVCRSQPANFAKWLWPRWSTMNHRSVPQRSPSGKPKQNLHMKPVGYVLCLFHVLVNCNNLCHSVSICHTNFRIVDCEALSLPSFPTTKTTKNTIKYRKIQQETWAKSKNYEETCSKTALATFSTFSLAFFLGSSNYTFLDFSCSFSKMICRVWEEHERVFSVMAATIPWPSDSLETSNVRSTNDIKLIIHSKMLVNRD